VAVAEGLRVKLERHVGGLSAARKENYLRSRGWRQTERGWRCERLDTGELPLQRALHHQLTFDLAAGLAPWGWKVEGYTPRGYAQMKDPQTGTLCSLPRALRMQARREKRPVAELTYDLFLGALVDGP
jgi:hypothetical protein